MSDLQHQISEQNNTLILKKAELNVIRNLMNSMQSELNEVTASIDYLEHDIDRKKTELKARIEAAGSCTTGEFG